MAIRFYSEEIKFDLPKKSNIKGWIKSVAEKENQKIGDLNFIFCSDEYLLNLNKAHLNHNTYTDIITFDYSEKTLQGLAIISGEVFISIDRVKENALKFEKTFENELHRVIIHGVLHLFGYKDKTKSEREMMRKIEDHCLKELSESL